MQEHLKNLNKSCDKQNALAKHKLLRIVRAKLTKGQSVKYIPLHDRADDVFFQVVRIDLAALDDLSSRVFHSFHFPPSSQIALVGHD